MRHRSTLILCYHRVADDPEDPFHLCVRPENFAAHLEEIARRREPSTLADLSVPARRPRVVVTLDDGYSDNLTYALPIAESKGVPITIFVTSGMLGDRNGFWWDRLTRLLGSRPLGMSEICLPIGGRIVRLALGASGFDADLAAVRQRLLPLPVPEIERALSIVSEQWSVAPMSPADARPLTPGELVQLASAEVVTIGAHTVDHVRLRDRSSQEQHHTIGRSRKDLERLLGRSVTHFAYPFGRRGDFDAISIEAVHSAEFDTACTTVPGTAGPSTDPYRLPRRLVMDWGRVRFRAQMQRWKLG